MILVYRIVLVLLFSGSLNAIYIAIVRHSEFIVSFPGAIGGVYLGLLGVAVAGLAALVGLWFWRRWAVAAFLGLGVVAVVLDVFARAPLAHQIATATATLVVTVLVYSLRERFSNSRRHASGRGEAAATD